MSDALADAEHELANLAAHLETVVPAKDEYRLVALGLAHRARSLFLGFGQLLDGPAPAAAITLVRPMVELNLLLRFLVKENLHVELWHAEGGRQRLALLDEYANDPAMQERHPPLPDDFDKQRETLRELVKEARAKARAAGVVGVREKRGPVFPSIADFAKNADDLGMREAYTLAYRALGTNTHVGPLSFRLEGFTRHVGDLVSFSDQLSAAQLPPTRTLVVTMFASTLSIVSLPLALDIHEQADEIKQRFMKESEAPIEERIARELEELEDLERGR